MANSGLLRRFSAPFANAWRSLVHRFSRNSRGTKSFAKLYHDVQMCAYEDVQVMWSIIHRQVNPLEALSGKAAQAPVRGPSTGALHQQVQHT
ncbi:hypothetical protein KP509_14G063600 [Ceratopteris richardii]|uniref:Uncharacterized protein n=1 Tax=Ceratopteris richardii TaxID=49495 RepID=A0A8T2TCH1_CERRI|nr:hypothetical protein KP509_14G063600 [Ceratopteris richardii]